LLKKIFEEFDVDLTKTPLSLIQSFNAKSVKEYADGQIEA
jgi:hypothetical protein